MANVANFSSFCQRRQERKMFKVCIFLFPYYVGHTYATGNLPKIRRCIEVPVDTPFKSILARARRKCILLGYSAYQIQVGRSKMSIKQV